MIEKSQPLGYRFDSVFYAMPIDAVSLAFYTIANNNKVHQYDHLIMLTIKCR